jgi:DNA adenine methylase
MSQDRKGCFIMISNSDTDFIKELYNGFHINTVFARRFINCKAHARGKITELLITNYEYE